MKAGELAVSQEGLLAKKIAIALIIWLKRVIACYQYLSLA
jgi:hypothetical protein